MRKSLEYYLNCRIIIIYDGFGFARLWKKLLILCKTLAEKLEKPEFQGFCLLLKLGEKATFCREISGIFFANAGNAALQRHSEALTASISHDSMAGMKLWIR